MAAARVDTSSLREDVAHVPVDRPFADRQLFGDAAVRLAGRHQPQDLELARAQPAGRGTPTGLAPRAWPGPASRPDAPNTSRAASNSSAAPSRSPSSRQARPIQDANPRRFVWRVEVAPRLPCPAQRAERARRRRPRPAGPRPRFAPPWLEAAAHPMPRRARSSRSAASRAAARSPAAIAMSTCGSSSRGADEIVGRLGQRPPDRPSRRSRHRPGPAGARRGRVPAAVPRSSPRGRRPQPRRYAPRRRSSSASW